MKTTLRQSFGNYWNVIASEDGVALRICGEGRPLVLIPGMEGSGESCLDLAEWIINKSQKNGNGIQVILVDYKNEQSNTLLDLVMIIENLLQHHLNEPFMLWSQSFGNIIATKMLFRQKIKPSRHLLMSPFAIVPKFKLMIGQLLIRLTPRLLYRKWTPIISRWVFGPMTDVHPFLDALASEDPKNYSRRISWLFIGNVTDQFSYSAFPRAVWIGSCDKLINPCQQLKFFKANPDAALLEINVIKKTGHMLFPEVIGEENCFRLLSWLTPMS